MAANLQDGRHRLSCNVIVAWTPAINICPEWIWKAPLMSIVPAPPHHPDEPSANAIIVDGLECAT